MQSSQPVPSSARQVVIVTGAAGGIGRAVAQRLLRNGHAVMATDIAELNGELAGPDAACGFRTADARDQEQVQAVVDECVERWGRVDAVVNSGGWAKPSGVPVWEIPDEQWAMSVDANLTGSFHWVRAAAPVMIEQGSGHLILVASGSGMRPNAGLAEYAASKAGVIGLMRAAAQDLGPRGVQVNAICPGMTRHEGNASAISDAVMERYAATMALPRLSSTDAFSDCVDYLLANDAISSQTFALDSKLL